MQLCEGLNPVKHFSLFKKPVDPLSDYELGGVLGLALFSLSPLLSWHPFECLPPLASF